MSLTRIQSGPRAASTQIIHAVVGIVGGSALLAVAAHVAVPFWPVPITLQTLAVLALGATLGPWVAAGAVLAYLGEGLAGLPVFAHGAGFATLAGPTGGYLIGYIPAAIVAGLPASRGWLGNPLKTFASFLAADAVIFAFGVAWLATLVGWDKAIAGGLVPFLIGDALKIALATAGTQIRFGMKARA